MADVSSCYKAFGLRIASELSIPEWSADDDGRAPDIGITCTDLSGWKHRLQGRKVLLQGNTLLLHLEGTAVFAVEGGNRIWVSPEQHADEEKLRLCVTSTCMTALLLQRGILPLHGSAVLIEDRAYAFIGQSGAGKSTLAAALVQKGSPLLSDDIVAVSLSGGSPVVVPSYPQQLLRTDSLQRLGLGELAECERSMQREKCVIAAESFFRRTPVPLHGVFELMQAEIQQPELELKQGLASLCTLMQHTFRPYLIPAYGLKQWHFSAATELSGHISVYKLVRPIQGFTAKELAARVIETVRKDVIRNG